MNIYSKIRYCKFFICHQFKLNNLKFNLLFICCFTIGVPIKSFAYNPSSAASYADTWWNSRNVPMYADYTPNDCANYVSQCLIAGGLSLSAGTNGSGAGVDNWGCMPFCDYMHINLTTYQSCTYSGHLSSGYPSSFTQGDVAIFGSSPDDPNDPWEHAVINVLSGTPALDAHSTDRWHKTVAFYYPQPGSSGFLTGDFYHFNSSVPVLCNNDNSCGPFPLTIHTACINSSCSTIGASTQTIPFLGGSSCVTPYQATRYDDDVWFSLTPSTNSPVTIIVAPTSNLPNFDVVIGVYYGSCSNPTQLSCADLHGVGQTEQVVFTPTAGTTYRIRVFSYGMSSSNSGNFNICATQTAGAQPNLTKFIESFTTGTNSVTINITVKNIGNATSGACRLGYYLGINPGSIDYLIGTDNIPSLSAGSTSAESITVSLCGTGIPNGSYYITYFIDDLFAVSESNESDNGWYWNSPTMPINCACPQPTNDGCSGSFSATPLTFGSACNPISSTSCGATSSGFSSCVGTQDDDVFFSFVPTTSSAIITVASSAGYDAVFQVLSGPCGTSMTELACIDNTGNAGTETTTVTGLTTGTTYFIRVWHYGTGYGTTGNFTICVKNCAIPGSVTVSGGGTSCNSATLTASGGSGGTIYWQGTTSNGTSTSTPSTSQIVNASGTYYFRAYNSCGWGNQGSATVTIITIPGSVTVNGDGTFCNSALLTATGGTGGTIYWQGTTSNGTSTSTPSSSQTVTASGTYYFRANNSCGWGNQGSATVTINTVPGVVTVSGGGTFCNSAILTASGGAGGTIYWQGTTSNGTSISTPSSSQTVSASGTYYFRANNSCGWGTQGSATVTINTVPTAVMVSGGGTFCTNALLTANGGSGGTIYWQGTTSNGTSTSIPSSSQTVTSSNTYYFRANNGCGWGDQGSATVTINPTIVSNTNDNGSGSLRDMVTCAGANETITFTLPPMSLISLTSGEINITKNLTIIGSGISNLTISGNNISRIFHIETGKTLTLKDLTLKDANAPSPNGGALFVEGNLNLENVLLDHNFENSNIPKAITVISPGGTVNITSNVEIHD